MTSFNATPITTPIKSQFGLNLAGDIRVDQFAGGGGATIGQKMALIKANTDRDAEISEEAAV
jgi:hypothetical protein